MKPFFSSVLVPKKLVLITSIKLSVHFISKMITIFIKGGS